MKLAKACCRMKTRMSYLLGLTELPVGNRRFLSTHLAFYLFVTIPGVFINTFFYRQDGRISTVAIYTAICFFGSAVTMQFSSFIAIKKSPVFVIRAGVMLFNIFYLTLLLLQNRAAEFMPLLGILNALASGFYWQGYNMLMQSFTDDAILNRTLSLTGLISAAVNLVVPSVSGLVITNLNARFGYTVIFLIAFLFSLYTNKLSTRIPKVKANPVNNLTLAYKKILMTTSWRNLFLGEYFRGVRDMVFGTFLTILFFKFIQNEALLGANTTVCGLASIISFYLAGKIIKNKNLLKCVLVSSIVLTTLFLSLFLRVDGMMIFILSVINSLFVTYITNPSTALLYNMLSDPGPDLNFGQIMAAHEIFFALGRVTGLLLGILLSVSTGMYAYLFLVLNLSALVSLVFLKAASKSFRAEKLRAKSVSDCEGKECACPDCRA